MADINLRQALTPEQQKLITYSDLNCLVNWFHQFALEDDNLEPFSWIFRNGMPQQFADGKWGFTLTGDMGLYNRPEPLHLTHRISPRGSTPPEYRIELGSFYEVVSKYTEFRHLNKLRLKHPMRIVEQHLAALSRTLPNYLSYLCYKMFVGTEAAKQDCYLKTWIETYIEPSDGAQNGYKFYGSEGFMTINLSQIMDKKKVTEHDLKKKLEKINKDLRDDTRKIEVDKTQNAKIKTAWPKANITEDGQRTYALYEAMKKHGRKILNSGRFEKKYKHDQSLFEGFVPKVTDTGGLIFIMNKDAWEDYQDELSMSQQVTSFDRLTSFPGKLITTNWIDRDEGFVIQNGLIQSWIPDEFIKYRNFPYEEDMDTHDYQYELAHTIDKVDVYCSTYFKLKK